MGHPNRTSFKHRSNEQVGYPMFAKRTCRVVVIAGLVAVPVFLSGNRSQAEKATTEVLGGAGRYLTSLSTDKPIYRAREKVYVRGVILQAGDHTPLKGNQTNALIEIRGPKGDVVASGWTPSQ